MKEITLSNSDKVCLVDDEDYDWLVGNFYPWRLVCYKHKHKSYYYAVSKNLNLHRVILEKYFGKSNLVGDHIDGNGLNNQKSNLRYATTSQNVINSKKHGGQTSSIYKGVYKKEDGIFSSEIMKDGKRILLGNYPTERLAAIAYDVKSIELFGSFCKNNINDATIEEIGNVKSYMINGKKKRNCFSKYRGVSKSWKSGYYRAYMTVNGIKYHLGQFLNENEAALAHNKKAIELLGDKAKLNKIQ